MAPLWNVSWKIINDISIATFTEQNTQRDVFYYNDGETFGFGKPIDKRRIAESSKRITEQTIERRTIQAAYEFKTSDSPTRDYVRIIARQSSLVIASANEFGDITVNQRQKIK